MELAPLAIEFEPRMAHVVATWNRLTPWQRRLCVLEDLAASAGLTPGEFFAAVMRAAFEFTDDIAALLVAVALPEVVQASIKRALTNRGFEDRLMLLEQSGFLDGRVAVPMPPSIDR
jgi:hypothetical protein